MDLLRSSDGTVKLTFPEGYSAVMIPQKGGKNALCLSCQVGCPVGCIFCYTAKLGFIRNLKAEEIIEQYEEATRIEEGITSIIFMGMGEPMTNYTEVKKAIEMIHDRYSFSYKKMTLSTIGMNLKKLEGARFRVAISLHTPFDEERKKLIPAAGKIEDIVEFSNTIDDKDGVMIAYALISGINDSEAHLDKLLSYRWNRNVYFNLIEFNDIDDLKKSDRLQIWKDEIIKKGFKCFIRRSRGKDIGAACGMLDI